MSLTFAPCSKYESNSPTAESMKSRSNLTTKRATACAHQATTVLHITDEMNVRVTGAEHAHCSRLLLHAMFKIRSCHEGSSNMLGQPW
jgi:hypothetical protein